MKTEEMTNRNKIDELLNDHYGPNRIGHKATRGVWFVDFGKLSEGQAGQLLEKLTQHLENDCLSGDQMLHYVQEIWDAAETQKEKLVDIEVKKLHQMPHAPECQCDQCTYGADMAKWINNPSEY